MDMHQSVLDSLHQDMFEYKIKQDETSSPCSSDNQDLDSINKVIKLKIFCFDKKFFFCLIANIKP